jgi:pantoate--beta-alanine ligase
VVTRLAKDLDLAVRIVAVATIREPDGLALSSRNAYLSNHERQAAPALHRVLRECAGRIMRGEPVADVLAAGRTELERAGFVLDYLEARNAETLERIKIAAEGPIRLLAAARIGKTRLIDNVGLSGRPARRSQRPVG